MPSLLAILADIREELDQKRSLAQCPLQETSCPFSGDSCPSQHIPSISGYDRLLGSHWVDDVLFLRQERTCLAT